MKPDFAETDWKEGRSGFGRPGTPGARLGTRWAGSDIWLRRRFELKDSVRHPVLLAHHDEDAEVYINGVLAARLTGYTSDYEEVEMTPEARAALRSGENVIAVHCHQTQGGQYIDVGLESVKDLDDKELN